MSFEVLFEWPVCGGTRSDAYIVDTTDRSEAVKRAKRVFREDHGSLRDVQVTTRRCNCDGTTTAR